MIKSMTGYGKASYDNDIHAAVEIKTLNSKYLDTNIRLPKIFSDKEIEVKGILSNILERGKINVQVEFDTLDQESVYATFKKDLFKQYYNQLKEMAEEVGADQKDVFRIAIQVPEVMKFETDQEVIEKYWKTLSDLISEAAENCDSFRVKEGEQLKAHLEEYANKIEESRKQIESLESERIEKIKARIKGNLTEFLVTENDIDQNRFEQELIYYIEKLDIHEELTRLSTHLNHFHESLNSSKSNGKKLGFISQEIGREINTIGSKANDSSIQGYVIDMKEELEKIKEQVLNIL